MGGPPASPNYRPPAPQHEGGPVRELSASPVYDPSYPIGVNSVHEENVNFAGYTRVYNHEEEGFYEDLPQVVNYGYGRLCPPIEANFVQWAYEAPQLQAVGSPENPITI